MKLSSCHSSLASIRTAPISLVMLSSLGNERRNLSSHDVGAALDLLVEALKRIGAVQLGPLEGSAFKGAGKPM